MYSTLQQFVLTMKFLLRSRRIGWSTLLHQQPLKQHISRVSSWKWAKLKICPNLFLPSSRLATGQKGKDSSEHVLLAPQRRAVELIITGWLRLFSPPTQNRGRFTLISPGLSLSAFVAMEGLPRRAGCIDPNSIDLLAVNSRGWCFPLLSLTPLSSSVLFIQTAEVAAYEGQREPKDV